MGTKIAALLLQGWVFVLQATILGSRNLSALQGVIPGSLIAVAVGSQISLLRRDEEPAIQMQSGVFWIELKTG